jgi:uncharacterized protein with beta-barrel porin domain
VTYSTLGVRAGKRIELDNGTAITPRVVGLAACLRRHQARRRPALIEGGAGFSASGVPIAKDAAVVEAGLDLAVGESGKLGSGIRAAVQ